MIEKQTPHTLLQNGCTWRVLPNVQVNQALFRIQRAASTRSRMEEGSPAHEKVGPCSEGQQFLWHKHDKRGELLSTKPLPLGWPKASSANSNGKFTWTKEQRMTYSWHIYSMLNVKYRLNLSKTSVETMPHSANKSWQWHFFWLLLTTNAWNSLCKVTGLVHK